MQVAPFAGAWIEISIFAFARVIVLVAPFAGAWIEMLLNSLFYNEERSHPSRVRGLKFPPLAGRVGVLVVAPFAGAWIEIAFPAAKIAQIQSRTLRGCVD